ncbi:sigma-54 dependent transcriptional regulator [Patescibacteria group bacterium]|nr:sigma-54 dependent transcriptional regulator [Patescibacteria group bacterium]
MREFLTVMLDGQGYTVKTADNGLAAIHLLEEEDFDLILSDVKMPSVGGIALLPEAKKRQPNTPVILITAYADTETAVKAIKLGAYDYISKPFDVDRVTLIINKAVERKRLLDENLLLKDNIRGRYQFDGIIGKSAKMITLFSHIEKVAATSSNILLLGESGVGKELVARAIHNRSDRREKQFVAINCATLPENLVESELFGHEKGAFTGADSSKPGLFEVADGGTLLLDEIGELPLPLQPKLLRVLQEKELKRVGGIKDIKVDVRLIVATNVDLEEAVEEKIFRQDLYYRLAVISIEIPPLRERMEDIPIIVEHLIKRYNAVNNKGIKGVTSDALDLLERYWWPGNVRELENVIERAIIFADGDRITPANLPDTVRNQKKSACSLPPSEIGEGNFNLEGYMEMVERSLFEEAMKKAGRVKKVAAKYLGMSFRSFRYKLDKYGMGKDEKDI